MGESVNTGIRGEDLQSKFRVLDKPTIHPGFCINCGSVERPVVDFGIEVDYEDKGYGALLLCVTCVKQAASKFPEPDDELGLDEDTMVKAAYKAGITDAGKMISDELRDYADRLGGRFDTSVIPVYGSSDSVPESTEPADIQDDAGIEPAVNQFSLKTDGPASVEGSVGVSGDSVDAIEPFSHHNLL